MSYFFVGISYKETEMFVNADGEELNTAVQNKLVRVKHKTTHVYFTF